MAIKKFPRKLKGVVVSDKMRKTIVVAVEEVKKHPKYKKYYTIVKRFKAHDENNSHKTGDHVEIVETRPISKDKRWKVLSKEVKI
ncbi:MAG: 30S ribosomal protein S17 [Parcubacteria group bacterium GW2011_GWA2_39_18]|nr:MAG: 30S ribosomal protein S17 [Parcubacteria group bacterium GW2011_GWA2_39_18]